MKRGDTTLLTVFIGSEELLLLLLFVLATVPLMQFVTGSHSDLPRTIDKERRQIR